MKGNNIPDVVVAQRDVSAGIGSERQRTGVQVADGRADERADHLPASPFTFVICSDQGETGRLPVQWEDDPRSRLVFPHAALGRQQRFHAIAVCPEPVKIACGREGCRQPGA